ncbi:hypothetical protein GCM10010129_35510 [Streptomyces fumigatiscleroticus]|nr:hypothetical protein GCM10010129_35510 [Streptomyces fumigatiscleroticus]
MGSGRGAVVGGVEPAGVSGVPFSALTRRLWLRGGRGLRVGSGAARAEAAVVPYDGAAGAGAAGDPRLRDVVITPGGGRRPGQMQREAT